MDYARWCIIVLMAVTFSHGLVARQRPGCGMVPSESCTTDFDLLEQLAQETEIYEQLENNPPQPIEIWAAKIGLPLLHAYILFEKKMRNWWHSGVQYLTSLIKKSQHKKVL